MRTLMVVTVLVISWSSVARAQDNDFDGFGSAAPEFVAIDPGPDIVFELGLGAGFKPAYMGATTYEPSFSPIVGLERLHIPGVIDIGGGEDEGGFTFAPSFEIISKRKTSDYDELRGLDDVDATYSGGARVGYELLLTDAVTLEGYGKLRYGFGGSSGLLGEVGAELTTQLTPELEVKGGAEVAFASEDFMDSYFGVTRQESARSGSRLSDFDPSGGLRSVSLAASARYEFVPDTFLNLEASYTRLVGDAYESPIVRAGSPNQFGVMLGLSRRFSISY
jgi:MipA family protein